MIAAKPKAASEGLNFKHIVGAIAALALMVGGYWFFALPGGGSELGGGGSWGSKCRAENYRTVKLLDKKGQVEMTVYVHGGADQISDLVASSSAGQATLPDSHIHNFYKDQLCNSEDGKCVGIVLDIGAHLGVHSLVLAKAGFTVHAFEPFVLNAELLQCSVNANKFDIHVVPEGVSNDTSSECMIFPMSIQSHRAMFMPKGLGHCKDTNQSIPVVTVDHYWEAVLQKKPIHFIRIDASGHEELIMGGMKKVLAASPPNYILMHFNPGVLAMKQVDVQSFVKTIVAAKYRIYDCSQRVEVKGDVRGDAVLQEYKDVGLSTDLLLVRAEQHTGDLPDFGCGL